MAANYILNELAFLRETGEYAPDTILICENGIQLLSYGLLLSCMSPMLKAALQPGRFNTRIENDMKVVDIDSIKAESMTLAIDFVLGKSDVITQENVGDLLQLADILGIEPLRHSCAEYFESILTTANASSILAYAESHNCPTLAEKANLVISNSDLRPVVQTLMTQLLKCRSDLQNVLIRRDASYAEERKLNAEIVNISERIAFEEDKAYREVAALSASAIHPSLDDDNPYPYIAQRTLTVVTSLLTKRKIDDEDSKSLEFESLRAALAASRPGDLIQLPPGIHDPVEDIINKSIQIVGSSEGVSTLANVQKCSDLFIQVINSSQVRLAHLTIDGTDVKLEGLVRAEQGACVWLEDCELLIHEGEVAIGRDSSMVMKRCNLRGGYRSAVIIDPQAKSVSISDCLITGASKGSPELNGDLPGHSGKVLYPS
jgi:hypothetical protein